MTDFYFPSVFEFTEKFNLLRPFAGIFFGTRNLFFASGKADVLKKTPGDYFCYAFVVTAALSVLLVAAWKSYYKEYNTITRYEKFIYNTARMGVVLCFLNIAVFDKDFVALVQKNDTTKIIYGAACFLMATSAILIQPIQDCISSKSNIISAFSMSCPKSGVWAGTIFAGFLAQSVIFQKPKTDHEVDALSIIMEGLFFLEWALCYAAITKKDSVENAKKFTDSPLNQSENLLEIIVWWLSFILDSARSLIGFFANIMVIPNFLQLAPSFAAETKNSDAQKIIYAILSSLSVLGGINHLTKTVSTRTQSIEDVNSIPSPS